MSARRVGSLRYACFLLPFFAAAVLATAPPQRAVQRSPVAGVSISSVTPADVRLLPGGDVVKGTLQGRNLDRRDLRGEALLAGRVNRGVQVTLSRPGANGSREILLCASAKARPGSYAVQLRGKGLLVPLSIRVQVAAAPPGRSSAAGSGLRVSACGVPQHRLEMPRTGPRGAASRTARQPTRMKDCHGGLIHEVVEHQLFKLRELALA